MLETWSEGVPQGIVRIGIRSALQEFQAHFSVVADILAYEDDGNIMTTASHEDTIIGWITPRFKAIGLALNINKSAVLTHPKYLIQQTAVGTEILGSPVGIHDCTH